MKKKFVSNSCDTVASVSYLNLLMPKYLFTCRRSNTSLSFSPSATVSGLMQHGGLPMYLDTLVLQKFGYSELNEVSIPQA